MTFPQRVRQTAPAGPGKVPVVFLSYSHGESQIALAFRDALAACGLDILIDRDHLQPSEDIVEFARRSVRAADATVCLLSPASLGSAWVVFEAVTTLQKEHADPAARLIACATDDAVFRDEIRIEVTKSIDDQVATLNQRIGEYLTKQLDLNELSVERSRLLSMRASLGDVLYRLRNSLTLIVSAETLAETSARIADHIRATRGQSPSRTDPRDIRARAEELRRFLFDGRTEDALDRLLDYVHEFSDLAERLRDAIALANTLRRIDRAEKDKGLKFNEAEASRQPTIRDLLKLIDDVEVHPQLPIAS